MARHLDAAGFDAVGVANGETGLARLRYERPDVCVLDLMLLGIDGRRVIEQARSEGIERPSWSYRHVEPSTTGCTRSRSEPTTTS